MLNPATRVDAAFAIRRLNQALGGGLRLSRVVLVCFLVLTAPVVAEDLSVLAGTAPTGTDGGEYPIDVHDDVSPAQRAAIRMQLEAAAERLGMEGRATGLGAPVTFAWPLAAAPQLDAYGFHGISNFVDQNPAFPNQVLDYNCGTRTYDLASGYNHSGVDIFLWPFAWNKVENDEVYIVAAAAGTILHKADGNPDHNCDFNNPNWNAVYVEHADGSVAWYGHMKRNSLTAKNVGETVEQGEVLGVVGSSGSSTGPHLHLEVYDANGDLVDPFQGPCNALNTNSWWAEQRPYYDSAINELTTGSAPVDLGSCPNVSTPNKQDVFVRGSAIYFTSYYRDQRNTQTSLHTIYRPDGSTYSSWSSTASEPFYTASYWYWYFTSFASAGPTGTWQYEIVFNGLTYTRAFTLVDPINVPSSTPSPTATVTPIPTDTKTRTATSTRTPTRTPSSTWTASPTRTATRLATTSPTATDTAAETAAPTVPPTLSPVPTLAPTSSALPIETAQPTPSTTDTPVPTVSPSATVSATAMPPSPTLTASATETSTPEPTATTTIAFAITATPRSGSTAVASSTPTTSATSTATLPVTPSLTPTRPPATATALPPPLCVGDCGADGAVTVSDLVRAVNIALGKLSVAECPAATRSGGNVVAITDLVAGVNNALRGCPVDKV